MWTKGSAVSASARIQGMAGFVLKKTLDMSTLYLWTYSI